MEQDSPLPDRGRASPGRTQQSELTFTIGELAALRALVSRAASAVELERGRAEDLVLAVNELACNSIRHAGGGGTLRMWVRDAALLCEVSDHGHLATRVPERCPPPDHEASRGLWLVSSLCDEMEISSSPDTGSAVRVAMKLKLRAGASHAPAIKLN